MSKPNLRWRNTLCVSLRTTHFSWTTVNLKCQLTFPNQCLSSRCFPLTTLQVPLFLVILTLSILPVAVFFSLFLAEDMRNNTKMYMLNCRFRKRHRMWGRCLPARSNPLGEFGRAFVSVSHLVSSTWWAEKNNELVK